MMTRQHLIAAHLRRVHLKNRDRKSAGDKSVRNRKDTTFSVPVHSCLLERLGIVRQFPSNEVPMRALLATFTIATVAAIGCGGSQTSVPDPGTNAVDQSAQEELDAYTRRNAILEQQMTDQGDGIKRASELLSLQEKLIASQEKALERQDVLLTKWEEMSRRAEAVLKAEEKKAGITP